MNIEEVLKELNKIADSYNELLMTVQTKHPGETRHETALRYIKQREKSTSQSQAN